MNKNTKLKNILTHNISLKILSFVIAVVLWVITINVNNPPITVTYSLPLEILNTDHLLSNNLVVLDEKKIKDNKIDVTIKATRNDLKFIKQRHNNIKAIIDLKDINASYKDRISDEINIPIDIIFSNYINDSRYQVINSYPSSIDIKLDDLITVDEQIYYETDGDPIKNCYIDNVILNPDNIKISGAKSILDVIKPITINLSTAGATKNIFIKTPIRVFDKSDVEVTDLLNLDNKYVEASINISTYTIVPVEKPNLIGKVADGYVIKSIDYEPKEMKITGDNQNNITSIKLPDIDIDQASLSKVITIDVNNIIGDSVDIKKGDTDKIIVTVNIDKLNTHIIN
jgi:hypothetical protein